MLKQFRVKVQLLIAGKTATSKNSLTNESQKIKRPYKKIKLNVYI